MMHLERQMTDSVYLEIVERMLFYLPVQLLHAFIQVFRICQTYFVSSPLLDITFSLQLTVVIQLSLGMVLLTHI